MSIIEAAKARLFHDAPYLIDAATRATFHAVKGLGTMGVDDQFRIYVDEEIYEGRKWSVPELAAVLEHEIWHPLMDHKGRLSSYDRLVANLGGDAEINDGLRAAKRALPKDAIYPEMILDANGKPMREHLTAEVYCEALRAHPQPMMQRMGDKDGHEGSGATGRQEPWELGPSRPGLTPPQAAVVRRAVAEAVRATHARGTLPAGLRDWADGILAPPRVKWQTVLRGALRGALARSGAQDYSWARISQKVPGLCLPGLRAPKPDVTVVGDTSGSMGTEQFREVRGEIEGLCRSLGSYVTYISCDAEVHGVSRISSGRRAADTGHGGTDMRVGIAEAVRRRAQVVVVLTDGYTPWPERPVSARVVAVIVSGGEAKGVPSWIRTVRVEP